MRRWAILTSILIGAGCSSAPVAERKETAVAEMTLAQKIARFAPTEVTVSTAGLSAGDQKALAKIIEAAKLFDPLFQKQVWSGNAEMEKKLAADTSAAGKELAHYFKIMRGPWSRLDQMEVFVPGAPKKPEGAGFYPEDMPKQEFETWAAGLTAAGKEQATSFFTTIHREGKTLKAVPYSEEYRDLLAPSAKLLREAAALTTNATLKKFLSLRAAAFESNNYYASDVAWMELDAPIDVTIGPYETYEDELFGYKAAYEAYVGLRDEGESVKLARFSGLLQELENNLPMEPRYRNPKIGAAAPIRVIDVVFTSGDGNRGVQTAAYNLPNDDRVIKEKGSKRVMLKNVQQAKFDKTLVPISKTVLPAAAQGSVSFDAFFTHVLAHELMHGIGPHNIEVNGADTTVRLTLKDQYSAIEEARADITGLWALQYLIDHGKVEKDLESKLYTTFLASMFRSVRFGINEAHGKGVALQFNYLSEKGAIVVNHDGTFAIDNEKIKAGVTELTRALSTIEAEGNYVAAKQILDRYSVVGPAMQKALESLKSVPVDIEPSYPLAK